jgi:hypothetical protein
MTAPLAGRDFMIYIYVKQLLVMNLRTTVADVDDGYAGARRDR